MQRLDHFRGRDPRRERELLVFQQTLAQRRGEEDSENAEGQPPQCDAPAGHVMSEQLQRGDGAQESGGRGDGAGGAGSRLRDVVLQTGQTARGERECQDGRGDVAAVPDSRLQPHVEVRDAQERADRESRGQRAHREIGFARRLVRRWAHRGGP